MEYRKDMHVHTRFSCDSDARMDGYIQMASKQKVDVMCFTDHVDYNLNDCGYGYYNVEQYFKTYDKYKNNDVCMILTGIEISEPHLYRKQIHKLLQYPFDFIIGSIHWIGDLFPCKEVRDRYSAKEFYTLYWNEVLKSVEAGGFQCLGHIDFPKRYYGEVVYDEDVMKKIFATMVKKDIVLEVNTSSIRKGIADSMPGFELLQLYKNCGGRYVTTGSDAHIEDDLAADFDQADRLIHQVGLEKVYFVNRKMVPVN